MPRGKDLKKRKNDKYSEAQIKRAQCPAYRKKLSKSISLSRKNEKLIDEAFDLLSLNSTIIKLNKTLPWSQGTNRKIYKDKQLYGSILHYTDHIDFYGEKISEKIYFLLYMTPPHCGSCDKKRKFNSFQLGYSGCNNKNCIRYSRGIGSWKKKLSEDEFKKKYEKVYKIDGSSQNSKEWYLKKYGEIKGLKLYGEYHEKMKSVALSNLSVTYKSSKAADKFFKELLFDYPSAECEITTGERKFYVEGYSPNLPQSYIYIDFLYDNKIVEYDGDYFHQNNVERDNVRDNFLRSLGYDILRIKHSECKRDFNDCVERAKKFLSSR
jgi:hypothetical protein